MAYPPPVPSIADANRLVVYTGDGASKAFDFPFPVFGSGEDVLVYVNGVWQGWPGGSWQLDSHSGVALPLIALPVTDAYVSFGTAPGAGAIVELYGFWEARQGALETSPGITRREYQETIGQIVAALRETQNALVGPYIISKISRANSFLAFDANGTPYPFAGMIPATSVPVSSAMAVVVQAADYPTALSIMGLSTYFQTLIGSTSAADFYTRIGGTSFGGSLAAAANAAAALNLLGVSAFMQTVLPAANATAVLNLLGLTAFGQSLVDDANAGAALTTLGLTALAQSVVGQSTGGGMLNLIGQGPFRRQTAVGGPVSPANGQPSFLPATSGSLSLISQNVSSSAPLVVASANGAASGGANDLIGIATSNLTWSGLAANATNYLYVTVAASGALTVGSTTLAPIYQWYAAPSTANGQISFNIAEMKAYIGNGSAAAQANIVVLGEAVTSLTGVTSTAAYQYNGQFVSTPIAVPATSTQTSIAHNLGVPAVGYRMTARLVCTVSDKGYPIGAEIDFNLAAAGSGTMAAVDQHNVSLSTAATIAFSAAPYAGGAPVTLTTASWNVRVQVERVF